jgi:hypothetical protein
MRDLTKEDVRKEDEDDGQEVSDEDDNRSPYAEQDLIRFF